MDRLRGFYGVTGILAYARLYNARRDFLDPIFFEDLPLGGLWTTRRRTITPADLTAFAGVAAEFSPLVVDETYARSTAFGGQVVPGSMIAALAIGLGSLDVPIPATAGMVGMTWRFLKPVRPGDSPYTTWRLNRKRAVENPEVGLVFWQIDVFNQRGEVVATGEVGRLVQRRAVGAPAAAAPRVGTGVAPVRSAVAASVVDEAAAEPAARRRRRRGGRGAGGGAGGAGGAGGREAAPAIADVPEPAPADPPAPSRRRRRRRSSNGTGGAGAGVGSGTAPSSTEAAPPAPPVEPTHRDAAESRGAAADGGRGLRGVFRRLRGGGAGS
jgi:acyl dehydratase